MTVPLASRPIPSLPFTIIVAGPTLHLIAGEDVRYTLQAGDLATPLADLLHRCDGQVTLTELLRECPEAAGLVQRLYGERILIDGPVEAARVGNRYRGVAEGSGPLVQRLTAPVSDAEPLPILCQDALDYRTARDVNRRYLHARQPWLWVTTGPAQRGYVSPVFLPDAGPCLACLLDQFQRLSPAPQLYDALVRHGEQGGKFPPTAFPAEGLAILESIARWKIEQLRVTPAPPAVFRLHVLELESLEVSVHRVFLDPTCPECADARLA